MQYDMMSLRSVEIFLHAFCEAWPIEMMNTLFVLKNMLGLFKLSGFKLNYMKLEPTDMPLLPPPPKVKDVMFSPLSVFVWLSVSVEDISKS